jgi:flagellar basal body rod protein FlgG
VPINDSGTSIVTKSGDNELDIDGVIMTLSGNQLLPVTDSFNENDAEYDISVIGTVTVQGTVAVGLITVDMIYSGEWTNSQTQSGTLSGTAIVTFTKQ